jgi:NAD(P)-dependent dehydrogenase (short-subunit alcohol dehydrogenase family)
MSHSETDLRGCRVLITGAARGIGAHTAQRLHTRGAKLALLGIEPDLLQATAAACDDACWQLCDVTDREQVDAAVQASVERLGGLDVVIANAGVAAQLALVGGDPRIFEQTLAVNLLGTYYVARTAGPHISHPGGYALLTASLAAAVHVPLLGAYSASKAAVEALGNTLRIELAPSGARVGVAYYAELDTDMTTRGFGTQAAARITRRRPGFMHVSPLEPAIDAIERGVRLRSRRVVSPRWVAAVLPARMLAQRAIDLALRRGLSEAIELARTEHAPLTTSQPESSTQS